MAELVLLKMKRNWRVATIKSVWTECTERIPIIRIMLFGYSMYEVSKISEKSSSNLTRTQQLISDSNGHEGKLFEDNKDGD